jgi:hypothetical protein
MLRREGFERGGHCKRRLADLRVDEIVDLSRVEGFFSVELKTRRHEPPDAFRREVGGAQRSAASGRYSVDPNASSATKT